VLAATGDSWFGPGQPDATHGSETLLHVDANGAAAERTVIEFNVNSGIPGGAQIQSATLTLCMQNIVALAVGRTHQLHLVTGAWNESTVTMNTAPTFSSTVTASVTVPATAQCVTFDVAGDVQAWVDGTPMEGWVLKDASENAGNTGVFYASREHGTSAQQPRLTVTFTD